MSYPARVEIAEVGLRDGLQAERGFVPTAVKAELLNDFIDCGIRRLEVTSFVSPRAVPALADAAELLAMAPRLPGLVLAALVPNPKGAQRAVAAGVNQMVLFVSASETHNTTNLNKPVADTLAGFPEVAAIADAAGIPLHGAIATAFGCPFEGDVPVEAALRVAETYAKIGVRGLSLGDTTGMATPPVVTRLCEALAKHFPELPITLHFHNTRGMALANVMNGLQLGITRYESSIGGLGGCPFAPGATGNVCTEDLVNMLHELGIETGLSLDKLIAVAQKAERIIGRPLPGQVMRAGPRSRLYDIDSVCRAVG